MEIIAVIIIVAILILSVTAIATPAGRVAVKTALFIPEVVSRIPVKPQRFFVSEPQKRSGQLEVSDGVSAEVDIYEPAKDGIYPGVVLFLGVVPAGRDDERVVNLANALARSGIVVLIPWSDAMMTSYRIDMEAADLLVASYQFLEEMESVDKYQIGLTGFCVGASFATLAGQDERIRDKVAYVNLFGPYYDASELLLSISSSSQNLDGVVEEWNPREDAREVFTTHLIEAVSDKAEQLFLKDVLLGRASYNGDKSQSLSDVGETVYKLLSNPERGEAEALFRAMPSSFHQDLESISPKTNINKLEAPILIMHDRYDQAVPVSESRKMANSLESRRMRYTEFLIFEHVDPNRDLPLSTVLKELWKLYIHMYNVMKVAS